MSSAKHTNERPPTQQPGSNAGKPGKPPTGLGTLQYLADLATNQKNHRRAEAMGDAQLVEHWNHYAPPPEDVIQYQSPTTHHHHHKPESRTGAGLLLAAALALAGSGGGAGWIASQYLTPKPAPATAADTDTQNTLRFLD